MKKAFDRVWHDGLVFNISQTSAPRRAVKVISSFLRGRTFRVALEGALSSERPVAAGVPQGSCLSPSCYACYTDDIPAAGGAQISLYADDLAFVATSISMPHAITKMQRALDALPDWRERWKLSVNVGKTQAVQIGYPTSRDPSLKMTGYDIPWLPRAKYLGVTIDRLLDRL